MLFREFVEICKRIKSARGISEKKGLISTYLLRLDRQEWVPYILFLTGNPIPDNLEGGLGIGYQLLKKALSNPVKPLLISGPPTLLDVYNTLLEIYRVRGKNSQVKKLNLLSGLMGMLSSEERRWLANIILGEMRIGVVEGHVLSAIAYALKTSDETVRRVYMLRGSLYETVDLLAKGVDPYSVRPRLYTPLRPMLGQPATSVLEGYNILGVNTAAVEYKYDGFRVQIHIGGDGIKLFSRRLTDVTDSFPELVELISSFDIGTGILDGEIIAYERGSGRPLPFQDLMKRFRRQESLEEYIERIPVTIKLFDVIYFDDKLLIDNPYSERRYILDEKIPGEYLSTTVYDVGPSEAEKIFRDALLKGHEGVMLKRMDSPYILGSRGKYWVKVKDKETLDLVIIGAEWGHGRRRGWLSDYYLGVYDEESGEYVSVGKTFKGLTDEEFHYMTKRLLSLVIKDEGYRVWVKPEVVVEVDFNEIQKSPKYRSGYALRLARIKRIREDKSPSEVATLSDIRELYRKQFTKKGRV